MANINFDTLVLKSDWAAALQSILDDAKDAIQQSDDDKKIELQGLLKTFIKRSPTMVDNLDDIALRAIDDLTLSVVDDAVKAIEKRNEELNAATSAIEATTSQAEKDAKAIQLKNVIDALNRAKSAVETLKSLEKNLAAPDQTLLGKISTVSSAIEDLINLAKSKSQS